MTSVGEKLRSERIRQGIDLAVLARDTRINLKYLQAIESGDPSKIPGGFFYRSFVRQYALALAMDPAELESELERAREAEMPLLSAALESAQFQPRTPDPIVVATNRRVAGRRLMAYVAMLVGVVAGCSAFYSWWRGLEAKDLLTTSPQPQVQAQSASPAPSEAVSTPAPARTAPDSNPTAIVPVAAPGPDDKVVVALSVREATWLSITSDGKQIFSGILEPSQTRVLGGKTRAFVRVGNAGGLEIIWNGKPIGPIGERGQVRNVLFTPENYQILSTAGSL
jgi:cytoskeletal protein RodZ